MWPHLFFYTISVIKDEYHFMFHISHLYCLLSEVCIQSLCLFSLLYRGHTHVALGPGATPECSGVTITTCSLCKGGVGWRVTCGARNRAWNFELASHAIYLLCYLLPHRYASQKYCLLSSKLLLFSHKCMSDIQISSPTQ